jgi:hypothetical protein
VRKERVQGAPTVHEVQKEPTEAQQSDGSASAKSRRVLRKEDKGKVSRKWRKRRNSGKPRNNPRSRNKVTGRQHKRNGNKSKNWAGERKPKSTMKGHNNS